MRQSFRLLPVITSVMLLVAPSVLHAEHRTALLIGNAEYAGDVVLTTPAENIKTVATVLRKQGFRTTLAENLDRESMDQAIERFIEGAPVKGTALIYFSGYVVNTATDDEPQKPTLLGVEANRQGMPLVELMGWLYLHCAASNNVIVLDGCNSHPDHSRLRELSATPVIQEMPANIWLGDASVMNADDSRGGESVSNFAKQVAASKETNLGSLLSDACDWTMTTCEKPLLSGAVRSVVAPPDQFPGVAQPGDEWVAADGTVFCFCPPGSGIEGFWIGKYEVPQCKWPIPDSFMGIGVRRHHPTNQQVTTEVIGKLETLTRDERNAGRLPVAWEYALPSLEQWEHAARAGTSGDRYFADKELAKHANFADRTLFESGEDYVYADATRSDGIAELAPVGSYRANAWGLHDVYGNVWELTDRGILCGGSWLSLPEYCRAGVHKSPLPFPSDYVGLRIAIRRVR